MVERKLRAPAHERLEIVSVHHTGSHFLRDLTATPSYFPDIIHWSEKNMSDLTKRMISPIRHPHVCLVSWYSDNIFGQKFFTEWEMFNDAFQRNLTTVVPVDTIDREKHLAKLEDVLGRKLPTDWAIVGERKRFAPPNIDISRVYKLDVVKHFYGETPWMY